MKQAKSITGKISLTDGEPLPQNFRILIGRKHAWDSQRVDVDAGGYFRVNGLPFNEAVTISIRVPGYSIDSSKTNLHQTRGKQLAVFTDNDLEHVDIFLKPKNK